MQIETRNRMEVVGGSRFTFHVSRLTPSSFVIRHSSLVIRSAFTLIELMLVMAVLTIAVSLTAQIRKSAITAESAKGLSVLILGDSLSLCATMRTRSCGNTATGRRQLAGCPSVLTAEITAV